MVMLIFDRFANSYYHHHHQAAAAASNEAQTLLCYVAWPACLLSIYLLAAVYSLDLLPIILAMKRCRDLLFFYPIF